MIGQGGVRVRVLIAYSAKSYRYFPGYISHFGKEKKILLTVYHRTSSVFQCEIIDRDPILHKLCSVERGLSC